MPMAPSCFQLPWDWKWQGSEVKHPLIAPPANSLGNMVARARRMNLIGQQTNPHDNRKAIIPDIG
jgi:hypothetical protein